MNTEVGTKEWAIRVKMLPMLVLKECQSLGLKSGLILQTDLSMGHWSRVLKECSAKSNGNCIGPAQGISA